MKFLIILSLILTIPAFAQSLKSIEQQNTLEEQHASEAWDREEALAQDREERIREINEGRAEGFEPQKQEATEMIKVDCQCPVQ